MSQMCQQNRYIYYIPKINLLLLKFLVVRKKNWWEFFFDCKYLRSSWFLQNINNTVQHNFKAFERFKYGIYLYLAVAVFFYVWLRCVIARYMHALRKKLTSTSFYDWIALSKIRRKLIETPTPTTSSLSFDVNFVHNFKFVTQYNHKFTSNCVHDK